MSELSSKMLLGKVLQEADLVSVPQIQVALQDQNYYPDLKIGEILALRGWLKQETADFFAQRWPVLLQQKSKHPIGYYMNQAGLVEREQIEEILNEQLRLGVKFGSMAVLKGYLKQTTLDFLLKNLCPTKRNSHWLSHGRSIRNFEQPVSTTSQTVEELARVVNLQMSNCEPTAENDVVEIHWID